MKFLIDSMFPPQAVQILVAAGHDALSPLQWGAHNLSDEVLIQLATFEQRVIVTENAIDFAKVASCPVLLVLKLWWPRAVLAPQLAQALQRWAEAHPNPGPWPHWLEESMR